MKRGSRVIEGACREMRVEIRAGQSRRRKTGLEGRNLSRGFFVKLETYDRVGCYEDMRVTLAEIPGNRGHKDRRGNPLTRQDS